VVRRRVTLLFALACGLTWVGAASAGAAPLATSGMNGWTTLQLPARERALQLAAIQAHGVQVLRSDAPWSDVQPDPPKPSAPGWQWAKTDTWVAAMAAHGLTWEPILDYSVWWAKRCPGMCAPASDATYAAFAQAVAARYGPGGSFWVQNPQVPYHPSTVFEIWNEENVSTYWVAPGRFARLYAAARTAIHAIEPMTRVIVGGLADDSGRYSAQHDYPSRYVAEMFAADPLLEGNVDGFGLHPYGASGSDDENWTVGFRHTLKALGEAAAPIYVTELGWTTGDAGRESWRASMMRTVASTLSRSDCGIQLLEPYDWLGPANPVGDFGLVDGTDGDDTSLRPAGAAWFDGLQAAASLPPLALCDGPRGGAIGTLGDRNVLDLGRWRRAPMLEPLQVPVDQRPDRQQQLLHRRG
jgi:hypothetical protein